MINALRRLRHRQRMAVYRALWQSGPFTRAEAARVAARIKFSPWRAARIIRAAAKSRQAGSDGKRQRRAGQQGDSAA